MRILIVKLSSLGDVVHAMPAVQDIRAALPHAQIDWVVEQAFAPLVRRCEGVQEVIGCELRRWRKSPFGAHTRSAWRTFADELRSRAYDAVIDLQGLTKSALVSRAARLAPEGKRYAMANQTDGSGYEAPTRWVADVAITLQPHVHAVARSRQLCERAFGFSAQGAPRFGLLASNRVESANGATCVALVHGTSRADKCWPEANWIELGRRLIEQGFTIAFPQGSEEERVRAERLARELGQKAQVWPRLDLGQLTDRLAGCFGVVGVDSGLSHIAAALDLPHVQIYNFDTAWRTGPVDARCQVSVFAQPTPDVEAVWQSWNRVSTPA